LTTKCPKCETQITSLNAYSLEENLQEVTIENDENDLSWDCSEPQEGTCKRINFECPECGAVLFTNKGDSRDERVIKFLKTGEYCDREKVEFT
jgi:predicted RNA-binding Zn-ribbon protein involved in translation (DUF1610 family)